MTRSKPAKVDLNSLCRWWNSSVEVLVLCLVGCGGTNQAGQGLDPLLTEPPVTDSSDIETHWLKAKAKPG